LQIFVLPVTAPTTAASPDQPPLETPRVFILDGNALKANRQRIHAGDKALVEAVRRLEIDAQKALTAGPFSIAAKEAAPPSGDKHDYMSQAPYFWRDPKSPNGLPYIRRDGERNPEINRFPDHQTMDKMVSSVETLALAYYFQQDEAYAVRAAMLLRTFFLDPATRMNPNLQYAQAIPGVNTGRGIGLIETRGLTRVVDAVGLLAGSKAWAGSDQKGIEEWFARFLDWMLQSKNGHDEAAAKNNHGTYYDVQTSAYALFLGKRELAASILQSARQKRIAVQIEPDGRQPLELARTRSWSYSVGNLDGLTLLARLGENVGVDLWSYQDKEGRGIRRALEYLIPFALGEKWPYQQLGEWQPQTLFPVMRRASLKYTDMQYQRLMTKVAILDRSDRGILMLASTSDKDRLQ
jgi:hypothetical protein